MCFMATSRKAWIGGNAQGWIRYWYFGIKGPTSDIRSLWPKNQRIRRLFHNYIKSIVTLSMRKLVKMTSPAKTNRICWAIEHQFLVSQDLEARAVTQHFLNIECFFSILLLYQKLVSRDGVPVSLTKYRVVCLRKGRHAEQFLLLSIHQ